MFITICVCVCVRKCAYVYMFSCVLAWVCACVCGCLSECLPQPLSRQWILSVFEEMNVQRILCLHPLSHTLPFYIANPLAIFCLSVFPFSYFSISFLSLSLLPLNKTSLSTRLSLDTVLVYSLHLFSSPHFTFFFPSLPPLPHNSPSFHPFSPSEHIYFLIFRSPSPPLSPVNIDIYIHIFIIYSYYCIPYIYQLTYHVIYEKA